MNPDKTQTLLLVDDTASNIDILVDLLSDSYDLLVALDGPSCLEILQHEAVDLVLLDIMMPVMDGYTVCREIQNKPDLCDIPVIFLTAKSDEVSIEQAYASGGIDYVTKPFKRMELLARIKTHLRLRSLMREMEYLAQHDSLTGLFNRRHFFQLASTLFDSNPQVLAAMIDIDDFKQINDAHGHAVGDTVIRRIATILERNLDPGQVAGRIGGEEFAVVATHTNRDRFWEMIERIRNEVSTHALSETNNTLTFRISCGVAEKTPDMSSIDALLVNADMALYQAKFAGKNRSVRARARDIPQPGPR
ncbi:MAG: diguanylate cyclase [Candidatus Thiodiazotropha sp.]